MRRWIGIGLGLVCLAGIAFTWLPVPAVTDSYTSVHPAWWLRVSKPLFLRTGEQGELSAEIHPPQGSGAAQRVSARLDLPGLAYSQTEEGEVVAEGGSAHLAWTIGPAQPGTYSGRLWIFASDRADPLLARAVQVWVFGPNPTLLWLARILFLAGLAESGLLIWIGMRKKPGRVTP